MKQSPTNNESEEGFIFYVYDVRFWITVDGNKSKYVDNLHFPCFMLLHDNWNDYGFQTTFQIRYYTNKDNFVDLGHIKILDSKNEKSEIPREFTKLDGTRFFSLAPEGFYDDLQYYLPKKFKIVLSSLNDIVYNDVDRKFFVNSSNELLKRGFENSLLRDSDSEKAYVDRKKFFQRVALSHEQVLRFNFSVQLKPNEHNLEIPFDFRPDPLALNRINVLIGKNGAGKTQTLSKLALGLSDKKKRDELNLTFVPAKPSFGRAIAVSYSLFDAFETPSQEVGKSYLFIGFRKDIATKEIVDQQNEQLKESIVRLNGPEKERKPFLISILSNLLSTDDLVKVQESVLSGEYNQKNVLRVGLSSGEGFIISLLTNIVANIREDSLILIDEPETHLHPNVIAQLIEIIHKILNEYKAYAIIATHSPIILQQIPSKYVNVLEKINGVIMVRPLSEESFGADLNLLNKEIFGIDRENQNFIPYLKTALRSIGKNQIKSFFNNRLNLSASLILENLEREYFDEEFKTDRKK